MNTKFQLVTKGLKQWVFIRNLTTNELVRMPLQQYNSVNHSLQPGDIFEIVQQNGRTFFKIEAEEIEYAEGGPWTSGIEEIPELASDSGGTEEIPP
jgi:hypothetical protein